MKNLIEEKLPFLWIFLEKPLPESNLNTNYDEINDYNVVIKNDKNIPAILFDKFFRRTLTITEVKKEKTDDDPS